MSFAQQTKVRSMHLTKLDDPRSPAETPGVPRPPNLKALTSIRFFAGLHVAFYHLVNPHSRWGILTPVVTAGYITLSFFFVLSGFILAYSHAQEYESGRGRLLKFYVARLARIYPVYLFTLVLTAWILRDQFHPAIHAIAFGADLLMVQSWSLRMVNFFNVPSWSLSNEVFFYLLFPFIMLPLRPSSRKASILAMAAFWLLAVAVPLYCVFTYPQASWSDDSPSGIPGENLLFALRRLPIFAYPQFLAGMALGWYYIRFGIRRHTASILVILGFLGLALSLIFSAHIPLILLHDGALIPVFIALILGLSQPNWISNALANPTLVLLGEATYPLYLLHYIFNIWANQTFGVHETILASLWKMAILIPLAVLTHLYIERPGRRLILNWYHRRYPTQLKPATP